MTNSEKPSSKPGTTENVFVTMRARITCMRTTTTTQATTTEKPHNWQVGASAHFAVAHRLVFQPMLAQRAPDHAAHRCWRWRRHIPGTTQVQTPRGLDKPGASAGGGGGGRNSTVSRSYRKGVRAQTHTYRIFRGGASGETNPGQISIKPHKVLSMCVCVCACVGVHGLLVWRLAQSCSRMCVRHFLTKGRVCGVSHTDANKMYTKTDWLFWCCARLQFLVSYMRRTCSSWMLFRPDCTA